MDTTPVPEHVTRHVHAFLEGRQISTPVAREDGLIGSGFRPLGDSYEVQIARSLQGPCVVMVDIHLAKGEEDGADLWLEFREEATQWKVMVRERVPGLIGRVPLPAEMALGHHSHHPVAAFALLTTFLEWYASLPDAFTHAIARLYGLIGAAMDAHPCFKAPDGEPDKRRRSLQVRVRPGTTATLTFDPDHRWPESGLLLLIRDDANRNPQQGFMAYLGVADPTDLRRGLRYDYLRMNYDGRHPRIPDTCANEQEALVIARSLIGFVARLAAGATI